MAMPDTAMVDLTKLTAAHRQIGLLWNLMGQIVQAGFGKPELFQQLTENEDLALQSAGQQVVPDLLSGRYDEGLQAADRGNVAPRSHIGFDRLLRDYKGPITDSEARAKAFSIILLDVDKYRFTKFEKPIYPSIAASARIEGDVTMRLSIDPASGRVTGVEALTGTGILKGSAMDAAKRWWLEPNPTGPATLDVTLRYSIHCP